MKYDRIVCLGNIFRNSSLSGRVYSTNGICASVITNGGDITNQSYYCIMKYRKLLVGVGYSGVTAAFNRGVLWSVSRTIKASQQDACAVIKFEI